MKGSQASGYSVRNRKSAALPGGTDTGGAGQERAGSVQMQILGADLLFLRLC